MSDILELVDKTIIHCFKTNNSAFLAPILCKLKVVIDNSKNNPTCATDGIRLYINEEFFTSLTLDQRITVILHETWHVARLHMLRRNDRDPTLWNIACDYRINNDLVKEGRNVESIKGLINSDFDHFDFSEEEIYDYLKKSSPSISPQMLSSDIKEGSHVLTPTEVSEVISNVVEASQLAKMAGYTDASLTSVINKFLKPVLPWEKLLNRFFTQLSKEDYSWRKPNRRYQDMYLPSLDNVENKLDHIAFFIDTSGSISDNQLKRFNSEVKYIHDTYRPEKLTVIQFDTKITNILNYSADDKVKKVSCYGRGGTDLSEVYDYICKNKPTASVIFTDLWCTMMPPVKYPVFWIISGDHPDAPFGKSIHIED